MRKFHNNVINIFGILQANNLAASISTILKNFRSTPIKRYQSTNSCSGQLLFPCIDQNIQRQEKILTSLYGSQLLTDTTNPKSGNQNVESGGPEPVYGKIKTGFELFYHRKPFQFQFGGSLPSGFQLAYETWGKLNEARDNAILVHTGLSASSHARSHEKNPTPGWWEKFIGPGLALDTDKFYVICTNVLGSCYGSTGPSSIDPETELPFATAFPIVTIFDMVRAQFLLLDHLGINVLHASVGSSMGGMQSLAAAALYPNRVSRCVSISACARSHPYSIALRHTQRAVLMSDVNWARGRYYTEFGPMSDEERREMGVDRRERLPPHVGMKLARMIATIGYRSGPEWEQRFGRRRMKSEQAPGFCPDYLIESYLDHQGERFCLQYDPNSLLYVSKAMDLFDMALPLTEPIEPNKDASMNPPKPYTSSSQELEFLSNAILSPAQPYSTAPVALQHNNESDLKARLPLVHGMARIRCPTLVLGIQSDILFPVSQQKEIAVALRQAGHQQVTYYELDSIFGHDTFLIDVVNVGAAVKGHLEGH